MAQSRIGVAGWSIAAAHNARFPAAGSQLERYSTRLDTVEINSSFHRSHRRATYERWTASVPTRFRFAVKLPKTITHQRRFVDCAEPLARFAAEIGGLGEKRGPVLVQLPPSFAYPGDIARVFFDELTSALAGAIALEPRHASWLDPETDAILAKHRVARVAADPAKVPAAAVPGGWRGLAYFRLHGAPRIYWSPYDPPAIEEHATRAAALKADGIDVWTIYDNTASGSAIDNALALAERLRA